MTKLSKLPRLKIATLLLISEYGDSAKTTVPYPSERCDYLVALGWVNVGVSEKKSKGK